ncbi:hypothetical protein AGR6A_Lc70017 [Agrobacterium sp. NCPPB 925]|nr:hypothetical protein AGR6A_Lc70017 [Agrobacterium sp. NCPPB 925]
MHASSMSASIRRPMLLSIESDSRDTKPFRKSMRVRTVLGYPVRVTGGMITITDGAEISEKRRIVIFFNFRALIFDSHLGKTLIF